MLDTADPETTNLYVGNLNPVVTEEDLLHIFGRYGPVASVKIMWPRTQEERDRGRNTGFIAMMRRDDAAKCIEMLSGTPVEGFELRLGWAKRVILPPRPIYSFFSFVSS